MKFRLLPHRKYFCVFSIKTDQRMVCSKQSLFIVKIVLISYLFNKMQNLYCYMQPYINSHLDLEGYRICINYITFLTNKCSFVVLFIKGSTVVNITHINQCITNNGKLLNENQCKSNQIKSSTKSIYSCNNSTSSQFMYNCVHILTFFVDLMMAYQAESC